MQGSLGRTIVECDGHGSVWIQVLWATFMSWLKLLSLQLIAQADETNVMLSLD